MPDLQELVRTVMALTPTGTARLFYVHVHEAEKLLKRITELEATLAERDKEIERLRSRYVEEWCME